MARGPSTPEANPSMPGTRELPLVALRETVIFPEMIVPLQVGREKSVNALNAAVAEGGPIALVTQRQAEQEDISDPSELYGVGTLAKIAQVVQLQDGTVRAIVQGQGRLRVRGFASTSPYLRAQVEEITEAQQTGVEVQALNAGGLADGGNTVVVIEHHIDVMLNADHIIDLGPLGGDRGGQLIAEGTPEEVARDKDGATAYYIREALERRGALVAAGR